MHLIWWAIGTLGIGGALFAGAVLFFTWPVVVQFFIGTKIGRALLFVGGLFVAAFAIFAKGEAAGKAAAAAKAEQARQDAIKARKNTDATVDALTPDQRKSALDKWLRD